MTTPKAIKKVLIANRGEIACRVIDTLRHLDINSVAVYSEADANALHVRSADEAVAIGSAPVNESYLLMDKVIDAAKATNADAIHPGYGFLSENAAFAKACADNDIIFIGPPVKAIEAMGSKAAAKEIMGGADVPLVPGYHGDDQSDSLLLAEANKIGYPVLLKAAMGGGGKGMRLVESEAEFDEALQSCRRESLSSFGDERMLIEKYVTQPRHVEIQVFADQHGNCVYLFERDCSLQRRHQKVVEEAPAPGMTDELRQAMGEAAVRAAQSIGYVGAGTVEFLLDASGDFYFMEMNTRLQVEHPVTEMITCEDLVEWQVKAAAGLPLPKTQDELMLEGHSFEVRIYAETPHNEFLPATGTITYMETPEQSDHVRIDTGITQGSDVTVFYDPMIAKLIVWDHDRDSALHRMETALQNFRIDGVQTNIEFLSAIIKHDDFRNARLSTHFIDEHQDQLIKAPTEAATEHFMQAALFLFLQRQQTANQQSPWSSLTGWQLNSLNKQTFQFAQDDTVLDIELTELSPSIKGQAGSFQLQANDKTLTVKAMLNENRLRLTGDMTDLVQVHRHGDHLALFNDGIKVDILRHRVALSQGNNTDEGQLTAPMNGRIVEVLVKPGDTVEAGTALIIVEAMKMEHTIRANADGTVKEVYYAGGDLVDEGAELIQFEPADE